MRDGEVLLVVDVQNDFCPGGRLAVPNGDEVVPVINRLAAQFRHVVLTQDWHPEGHLSFASRPSGQGAILRDRNALWHRRLSGPIIASGKRQGRPFMTGLIFPMPSSSSARAFARRSTPTRPSLRMTARRPTGLLGYLRERGLTRVTCVGLAFDYCVRYSAEDAAVSRF